MEKWSCGIVEFRDSLPYSNTPLLQSSNPPTCFLQHHLKAGMNPSTPKLRQQLADNLGVFNAGELQIQPLIAERKTFVVDAQ